MSNDICSGVSIESVHLDFFSLPTYLGSSVIEKGQNTYFNGSESDVITYPLIGLANKGPSYEKYSDFRSNG